MQRMRKIFILLLLLTILGCSAQEKPSATILAAKLQPADIPSGQTTDLVLDAKNNGDIPVTIYFNVTSELPEKVSFQYPQQLEYLLQPGETTGKKIVKVTASSGTVRTDYLITITLSDAKTSDVFEEGNVVLTVRK